jgi:hypothetical protein
MQPKLVRVLDSAGPLTVVSSIKQCCQAPRASPGWSHKQFLRKIWQPFQHKLDSQAGRSSVITSTIYNSIDYYLEKILHGYYMLQHYKERWLDGKEVEKSSSTFGLLLAYFVLSTPWLTPEKRFYGKKNWEFKKQKYDVDDTTRLFKCVVKNHTITIPYVFTSGKLDSMKNIISSPQQRTSCISSISSTLL